MKRIKNLWLAATILLLSVSLFGQDTKSDVLSYSLSYIPPSLTSRGGEFRFSPIYFNFEANIHYKPFDRISFSSGLGFSKTETRIPMNWNPSTDNYMTIVESGIRIPIQVNYHITKSPKKSDWYFKAVYTNGIFSSTVRSFENDELTTKSKTRFYEPSAGIGLGSIFLKDKPIGIIVEGTISKHLYNYKFSIVEGTISKHLNKYALEYETWYSLKIGVVF
jgi:hypothetical protein